MTNKSISQLSSGSAVSGTDLFPDVQTVGVGPVKITADQLKTFMSASPILVTPNIGVATGTSVALGGAAIGSNAFAVTGTSDFNGSVNFGTQQTLQGAIVLSNTAAGAFETTIKSSNSSSAAWTFTLPISSGSNGYVLTTDGTGVSSWSQLNISTAVTGTLGVGNGGTGTSTAFTTGSVVFAGASGVYSQDNSKLFWNDSTYSLGIGTASPSYNLQVTGNAYASSNIISGATVYGQALTVDNSGNDAILSFSNSGARKSYIRDYGDGLGIVEESAKGMYFYTSNTLAVSIDNTQNVLIGTNTTGASKLVVNDTSIQINNSNTPASASSTGTVGQICWDNGYIYVCVASNTWKRAAISTW